MSRIKEATVQSTVTSPRYVTTKFVRGQEFYYEGFMRHFRSACPEIFRITVLGRRFALNVADFVTKYMYQDDPTNSRIPFGCDTLRAAQDAGFRLLERFIWDKGFTRNFGGSVLGSYPYSLTLSRQNYFEYIWVIKKPGKRRVAQEVREKSTLTFRRVADVDSAVVAN